MVHLMRISIITFLFSILINPVLGATFVDNDQRITSYSDIGKGKVIVLIHPFPTDQRIWEKQQSGLKNKFRVITLDLWGFGQSSGTDGNALSMNQYADQVKILLDKLHIAKAIIGGESMGGYVALSMLAKYPTVVSGLILSNTQAIADSEDAKLKREATAKEILSKGTQQLVNSMLANVISSNASQNIKLFLKNILDSQSATGMASALRGMSIRDDQVELLSKTTVPVLIITSSEDKVIPTERSNDMHLAAKNSQLVIIKNAGHLSSLEQPDQWNNAVQAYFNPL